MKVHSFALGPFHTNSYLVEDETTGDALLVDPTIESQSILPFITEHRLHVALIVNTHGHIDHVFGDAFFKEKTGAPLAIHQADAPSLKSAANQAKMFGLDAPPAVTVDRLLADGDTVQVGQMSFRVIHTPGHTPGGICLYGHSVLFSGDTLFAGSIGRTDLPGGNFDQLMGSIRQRLLTLPDETIVHSGHGANTTIGEEKEGNPFLQ